MRRASGPSPGATPAESVRLKVPAFEIPFLATLVLGPVVCSLQELGPALLLGTLIWLSCLLRLLDTGRPRPVRPVGFSLALAFPLVALLTITVSANRGESILLTLWWATGAAALWLASDVCASGGAPRLIAALLGGAVFVAGEALREQLEHVRLGDYSWRVFARFANPNFLASCLVPSVVLALGLAFRVPPSFRPITWGITVSLLGAAFAGALGGTGSRGGFLSLVVGAAAFAVLVIRHGVFREWDALKRCAVQVLIVIVALYVCSAPLRSRSVARGASPMPEALCGPPPADAVGESNRFRQLTWKGAARMALARPVLGWGAGAFDTAFAPHAIATYTRHAHQGYLQLAAEEGAVGLLVWLGLLGVALSRCLQATREEIPGLRAAVGAALVAMAVHNLFDSVLYVPCVGLLTWVLFGVLLQPGQTALPEADPGAACPEAPPSAQGGAGKRRKDRRSPRNHHHLGAAVAGRNRAGGAADKVLPAATAAALLACLLFGGARVVVQEARRSGRQNPRAALEMLEPVRVLLSWDQSLASQRTVLLRMVGRLEDAATEAERAVALAPYRPGAYYTIANIHELRGVPADAEAAYHRGLRIAPNEVVLLAAYAEMLRRMGREQDALRQYQKVREMEDSEAGQVRALSEIRDFRFARARLALAADAERRGNPSEAAELRRAAACLLGFRRRLAEVSPAAYLAVGEYYLSTERELYDQELQVWKQLRQGYAAEGASARMAPCDELIADVEVGRKKMEAFFQNTPDLGQ